MLEYYDPVQNVGLFAALNSWPFGNILKEEDRYQVEHKDFPFVHWKEHFDDCAPARLVTTPQPI